MNIIVDSSYNPFTFDEIIKPFQMYSEAYKQTEDDFTTLSAQAEAWKSAVNQGNNPKAYGMYSDYINRVNSAVDRLNGKDGLRARQELSKLKKDYFSSIKPISDAYLQRQKHIEEQAKGRAAGLTYDKDASQASIDEYIDNPQQVYQSIDKNVVYKKAVTGFSSLAKELKDYALGKPLDQYNKTWIQSHGISREQAADFINAINSGNMNLADPSLRAIYNAIYNSTGVQSWKNPQAQKEISDVILEAIPTAIGQSQIGSFQDAAAIASLKAKYSGRGSGERLPYRRMPYISDSNSKQVAKGRQDLKTIDQALSDVSSMRNMVPTSLNWRAVNTSEATRVEPNGLRVGPSHRLGEPVSEQQDGGYNRVLRRSIESIARQYGVPINFTSDETVAEGLQKLRQTVASSVNKGISQQSVWYPNTTNMSFITEPWVQAVHTMTSNFSLEGKSTTPIKGENGKNMSTEDLDKIKDDSASYFTKFNSRGEPIVYLRYQETGDKGKYRVIQLPDEIVDNGSGVYLQLKGLATKAYAQGDYESAAEYMDRIQDYFDAAANTRATVQSNTDSKLKFPWIED